MTGKIPRRIIQIWGGKSELPLFGKAAAANLRLLNPDFEYVLFDDARMADFINLHFSEYRPVFESFRLPIQRYDLFRYLAVYRCGGFYFDTDVFLASSLEDLLEFGCIFPFEHLGIQSFLCKEYGMDWQIGNYAFGAAAGHPFLDAIIKNCIRAQRHPEWVEAMMRPIPRMFQAEYFVLNSTGPGLVSRTLAEYSGAGDLVKVLFPEDVCDPNGWYRFGDYGVHLQVGGWRKREGLVRRVLHRRWESTIRKALLKESLKRGRKRSLEFKRSSLTNTRLC